MDPFLTDILKQGPAISISIWVLIRQFGIQDKQNTEYKDLVTELKEVIKANTVAITQMMDHKS